MDLIRQIFHEIAHPWLLGLSFLIALLAIPPLVRFTYGRNLREVSNELGVGDPLNRQITLLSLLLYGRVLSLRSVVFFGGYLVVVTFAYVVLSGAVDSFL